MYSLPHTHRAPKLGAATACRSVLFASGVAFVIACADAPSAPRERTPQVSQATPSASVFDTDHLEEYEWHSGLTAVSMGTTSGRACFLTRVGGDFGTDAYVRIYSSNGTWYLSGAPTIPVNTPGGVNARARCSYAYSYSAEYSWSQGHLGTQMGSIYGRACFLTRVGGQLFGNGARVEVYSGNSTSWWLGGSSDGFGVHARARCLIYPPFVPQQPYSYTGWVSSTSFPKILQFLTWACYLAGMGGLYGADTFVTVYASGSSWYVGGKLDAYIVKSAKVGCTSK